MSEDEFKRVYDERAAVEKEGLESLKNQARKYLEDKKKGKTVVDLTPSSLTEEDILFLKTIFNEDDVKGKICFIIQTLLMYIKWIFFKTTVGVKYFTVRWTVFLLPTARF